MKNRRKISGLLGIAMALGCATSPMSVTKLDSFQDPEFQARRYNKVLVLAPFADIGTRRTVESIFADWIRWYDTDPVASLGVIMPTRSYDENSAFAAVQAAGADAILLLELTAYDENLIRTPETSITFGSAEIVGDQVWYRATTFRTGGSYVSFPTVKMSMKLMDVETRRVAWVGTSTTQGAAFAGVDEIMRSLAKQTLRALANDGHISKGSQMDFASAKKAVRHGQKVSVVLRNGDILSGSYRIWTGFDGTDRVGLFYRDGDESHPLGEAEIDELKLR